jgi:hypothetical protein
MMQVVVSIINSHRDRSSNWVSAEGDYGEVTSRLIKLARKDMNLTQAEDQEIEGHIYMWTPRDDFPLPEDEDHTRMISCKGFALIITARSKARQEHLSRALDILLGIE